jgi:hypothetical protein
MPRRSTFALAARANGGSKKIAGVNRLTPGFELGKDNRSLKDLARDPAIASALVKE